MGNLEWKIDNTNLRNVATAILECELEQCYVDALNCKRQASTIGELQELRRQFMMLGAYKDAAMLLEETNSALTLEQKYQKAIWLKNQIDDEKELRKLARDFKSLGNYKNAQRLAKEVLKSASAKNNARRIKTILAFGVISILGICFCKYIFSARLEELALEQTSLELRNAMATFFEGKDDEAKRDIERLAQSSSDPVFSKMLDVFEYQNQDFGNTAKTQNLNKEALARLPKGIFDDALSLADRYANEGDVRANILLGDIYLEGLGVTKNYQKALEYFSSPANSGNIHAQVSMAEIYKKLTNLSKSAEWYQKAAEQGDKNAKNMLQKLKPLLAYLEAAEQGNAEAQYNIGQIYGDGKDIEQNYKEAEKWNRQAAEQGYAPAQRYLGWMYEEGHGVQKDYQQAFNWYLKAAEQGNALAQNSLGNLYRRGLGVQKDSQEALKWYQKAGVQGIDNAQSYVFNILFESKDYQQAFNWFHEMAEKGYATSQYCLGSLYHLGYGTKQDFKEAVKWYQKAANQGHAGGQYSLGSMYEKGNGVQQDYKQAFNWYLKAAEQGNDFAQYNLAKLYQSGKGTKRDSQEAMNWYQKAANSEGPMRTEAQYSLGKIYDQRRDYKQASEWYRKAAENGHMGARNALNRIQNK